jgi:hypothetical protein
MADTSRDDRLLFLHACRMFLVVYLSEQKLFETSILREKLNKVYVHCTFPTKSYDFRDNNEQAVTCLRSVIAVAAVYKM